MYFKKYKDYIIIVLFVVINIIYFIFNKDLKFIDSYIYEYIIKKEQGKISIINPNDIKEHENNKKDLIIIQK